MVDVATIAETFTLWGILVSGIIFTRLALKSKSLASFRFQLSTFMLVWVGSEIPHVLQTLGVLAVGSFDDLGLALHMISMGIFAIFVGSRSANFLRVKTRAQLIPTSPSLSTGAIEK